MALSKIHSSIVPEASIKGNTITVWYEVKPNNAKKHLRMHNDDITYIHHWLSRFVMDVSQKQFINPKLYTMCTAPSKEMPKSSYAGSYNSVLSYASGIVGNRLRNPSEDYTKKQLRYISKMFDIICTAYDYSFTKQDLGYDLETRRNNDKPLRIKFKEVK